MYPKPIFSELLSPNADGRAAAPIRQSTNILDSHLIFHNPEKAEYQYFEIRVPFLLMYEAIDLRTDATVYMEFSRDRQICLRNSFENYRKLNRQLHSHDFYEITYVLSGRLTMLIEGDTLAYEAGECCVCNKNIHHVEVMDEDTELILLALKEDFVKSLLSESLSTERSDAEASGHSLFDRFFAENRRNPLYDAKVYADFRSPDAAVRDSSMQLINQMTEELTANHLGKNYMVRALLCRFLEQLESSRAYRSQVHSATLTREEQVVYKLAKAYRKRTTILTRAEAEKITGYCSDHVERIVKRHTGMTLSEYGRLFLIQKAAAMLRSTNKGVGEICEELGYSNRTYFNRIFRDYYGMTPGEYRRNKDHFPRE